MMFSRRSLLAAAVTGLAMQSDTSCAWFRGAAAQIRAPFLNVLSYGAVGNGKSNPAANIYTTLDALQQKYPFATALSNEMDWLGIEAAKRAAQATGYGGVVYLPAGKYLCDQVISPFPAVYEITAGAVSMMGDGSGSTFISFPNDVPAPVNSQFAITCDKRTTLASQGFFHGFTVLGPVAGVTVGVVPCNLSGIGWGARRQMEDVAIHGFYAGLAITGDHTLFQSLYIDRCYYGIYFDVVNAGLFGDWQFNKLKIVSCAKAAVAVAHTVQIGHSLWDACIFGACPYGILKETNNGAPAQAQIMSGATFINCQAENCGNAAISDDRTSATRVAVINSCEFIKCQWSWFSGAKIAALEAAALIDVRQVINSNIHGILDANLMTPGTLGIFNIVFGWSFGVIEGDIDSLIANCNAVNRPFFSNSSGATHCRVRAVDWEGILASVGALARGNYVVTAPAGTVPCNGDANDAPIGVIKAFWPGFTRAIVATAGHGAQALSGTAPTGGITAGQFLRTGPNGSLVGASGATDQTSPIVGKAPIAFAEGAAWSIILRPWEN